MYVLRANLLGLIVRRALRLFPGDMAVEFGRRASSRVQLLYRVNLRRRFIVPL